MKFIESNCEVEEKKMRSRIFHNYVNASYILHTVCLKHDERVRTREEKKPETNVNTAKI